MKVSDVRRLVREAIEEIGRRGPERRPDSTGRYQRQNVHGFRHGQKIGTKYVVDTKNDPDWVVIYDTATSQPVARQAKFSAGKRYKQGTNPDYDGHHAFPVDVFSPENGDWGGYSDDSESGEIRKAIPDYYDQRGMTPAPKRRRYPGEPKPKADYSDGGWGRQSQRPGEAASDEGWGSK